MLPEIDLNCDLGEQEGSEGEQLDLRLLPLVTCVNVACGGHAGSLQRLQLIALQCRQRNITFGAHPSYPDRAGFGRVEMSLAPRVLRASLAEQLRLAALAAAQAGIVVGRVKPHGALYHAACERRELAELLLEVVRQELPGAAVCGRAGSMLPELAEAFGLRGVREAFGDRGVDAVGRLLPRDSDGAVLRDPAVVAERVLRLVQQQRLSSRCGVELIVQADSVCIHSDTPEAEQLLRELRQRLEAGGVRIRSC
ncbi:MAG: putative lactam utilization protein family [Planctomycetota bacterium]